MKVGIVGASGYVGGEVVRLLLSHPEAEVSMVTSTKHVGEYLHRIHPSLKGFTELTFSKLDYDKMSDNCEIVWDTSKPSGDRKRIMSTERAKSIGIIPKTKLDEGIGCTIDWYQKHKSKDLQRYNAFTDKVYTKQ